MSSITVATRMIHSTARRNLVGCAAAAASQGPLSSSLPTASPLSAHSASPSNSARFLSTNGLESVGRFKQAMEDYRIQNYAQTIPPRFKKQIAFVMNLNASQQHNQSTLSSASIEDQKKTAVRDIERLLENIGALGEDKVSHQDVERIVSELGESSARDEEGIRAAKIVTELL